MTHLGVPVEHDVFRELIPAIASVHAAVDLLGDQSPRRELALRIAHGQCRRAATECRRHAFGPLLRCAPALARAIDEIELILKTPAEETKQN